MSPTLSLSSRSSAFTIVELLTVIAIIGVLAAILIPTVGRVRDNARNSHSISNLRQIGLTNQLYAQENQGYTVPGKDTEGKQWQVLLSPYTEIKPLAGNWEINQDSGGYKGKSFFVDPNWNDRAPGWTNGPDVSGYGLNHRPIDPTDGNSTMDWSWNADSVGGQRYPKPKARVKLGAIPSPSKRVLVSVWPAWNLFPTSSPTQIEVVQAVGRYKSGKINVVYFDAHVASLSATEFHEALNLPAE